MLTLRQAQLLDFMKGFCEERGVMPSYSEMADGINLSAKSGVHRMVLSMEKKGFLIRIPATPRAIELTDKALGREKSYGQLERENKELRKALIQEIGLERYLEEVAI